jgi:hypothetical protein
MAQNTVTIKFQKKGDEDLIQALNNLAKAQNRLNKEHKLAEKTSKKTRVESTKLNAATTSLIAKLTAQGKSFKVLGISSKTLSQAYQGNKVAIEKMRIAMKKYTQQQAKTRKGARLLDNSLATLRSQMLLFNFAMGTLGVKALGGFAKEASKVDDMARAFTNLSGGTENASIAVDKLKSATNGTIGEFDLFQQANNAMILGVTKNSDEMAHMFDVAQRLGAALGKDTAHSIESLITGIGRQSRLMLDNIGIIVKADEAYEKYARSLDTTVDKLTDAQKKQAFLTATMEAADKKLEDVGEEVISYSAKLQIVSARMADMRVEIGKRLLPLFSSLGLHFTDTGMLKGYGFAVLGVAATFVTLRAKMIAAAIANGTFIRSIKVGKGALIASGYGILFIALGELIGRFVIGKEKIDETTKSFKKQNTEIMVLSKSYKSLVEQKQALIDAIKKENELTKIPSPINPKFFEIEDAKSERRQQSIDENRERIKQEIMDEKERDAEVFRNGQEAFRKVLERNKEREESNREKNEQLIKLEKMATKAIVASSFSQAMAYDNAGKAAEAALRDVIAAKVQSMIMSLMEDAITKFGWLGVPLAATAGAAAGSLVGQAQRHWKFEDGGLVGGRRHSQGGTMIEAERGEFVMSRNAVNAVGVEAMNRINQGQGAGNVNISFAGNVMSQDFIEDEAIPMIKEAIRRGADIGVS